jgi:spore germination protein GerM
MNRKLTHRLAMFIAAAIALAGCGIANQASPVAIGNAAPSTTAPAQPPAPASTAAATLYFVSASNQLVATRAGTLTGIGSVIEHLLAGPSSSESGAGMTSAIPTGTKLLSAGVSGTLAKLDFSDQLASVSGQEQLLAFAEIVTTCTSLPNVNSVEISVAGQTVNAPLPDGTLAQGPVTQSSYAGLLAH